VGDETFKTHLDGFNQIGMLTNGEPTQHAVFYYFTDRGDLTCLRYDRWKVVLMQQNLIGLDVWSDPLAELRMSRIIDLRTDPFERAPEMSGNYETWMIQHAFIGYPVRDYAQDFQSTFIDFSPRRAQAKIQRIQQLIELVAASSN